MLSREGAAIGLDAILAQAEDICPAPDLMHTYEGVQVRQTSPEVRRGARLPIITGAAARVAQILARYPDERVPIFFRIEESQVLSLGSELLYNPYRTYLLCLRDLAQHLADAVVYLGYDGEDYDGARYDVIDRLEIDEGNLRAERRVSGPSEDFDESLVSLFDCRAFSRE